MNHWLMKSEPDTFSIDDLARSPRKTTHWDGVRNYQARGFMRDDMRVGDLAFFYYSNIEEPGIAGIVKIVKPGYPYHTAFDKRDKHYDADSDPNNPRWYMVDVRFERKLRSPITLATLREHSRIVEARQPTFDHAGERCALEIHSLARALSESRDA